MKPLPKSDEVKSMTKDNYTLEKTRAECKMLLRWKKQKAIAAAAVTEEDSEEAEEEDILFPKQSIDTDPDLNHRDRGIKVNHEGVDTWDQPFWFDKWHSVNEEPVTVSDACPFSHVDVTDKIAEQDCHMLDTEDLAAKKTFTRDDYNITLFSDRCLGRAKLVIYRR